MSSLQTLAVDELKDENSDSSTTRVHPPGSGAVKHRLVVHVVLGSDYDHTGCRVTNLSLLAVHGSQVLCSDVLLHSAGDMLERRGKKKALDAVRELVQTQMRCPPARLSFGFEASPQDPGIK
ncbi:hypothetical protein DNTS_029763 [Danionella cerebrum]|uniref:Uncharacterized protein n=1 Tax=Danionella cerebrum TaxID=2873325 RepID=A0A553PUI9_9TELE|nr:hypothetical protein DNTS_029763 [Danionella translucida]